ncbi:MAG: ribonuclease J [bacterium]
MNEKPDYLRVIPLGGLNQFGMNCCVLECNDALLMLDCGLSFPETPNFGIDYIIPDFSWLLENVERLEAIVLTHGHEDHIGGLPYLLEEVDVPVVGGRLTLEMIKRKLLEHDVEDVAYFDVQPGDTMTFGPFKLEFIHVNHSIPNAMSVKIDTPQGRLIFTGDWKLDQTPFGEPVMDLATFARLGDEGVLALLGDSTNVDVPGVSASETDVLETLTRILGDAQGRVIVALFSSNLHRVAGLMHAAEQSGRRVCLLGRSLERNFQLASELGMLDLPTGPVLIAPDEIARFEDRDLLILCTGSQAEPRSSLTRMAHGEHNLIRLKSEDTVVLSARVIPGNDVAIYRMLDALARKGVKVITKSNASVHASGHAHREELKLLLNLTKPRYVVPMHGDFRVRRQHGELGKRVSKSIPLVIDDGDVLEFRDNTAHVIGKVRSGRVAVDGKALGDIDDVQIRDRMKLAATGIVVAFLVLDGQSGAITDGPRLLHHGLSVEGGDKWFAQAAEYARQEIEEMSVDARQDTAEVQETLRTAVRRYFRKNADKKPVVIPIVHEL